MMLVSPYNLIINSHADPVYVVYFKTDRRAIREYPALRAYTQDLYQTPGIRESVNIQHIRTHYFTSHPKLNAYAIIPGGPEAWWEEKPQRVFENK
jgi:glutathionyl-hydroquinone reductase